MDTLRPARPPGSLADTDAAGLASPLARTEAPLQRTELPLARTEAPLQRTELPLARAEAPLQRTELPLARTEVPRAPADPAYRDTLAGGPPTPTARAAAATAIASDSSLMESTLRSQGGEPREGRDAQAAPPRIGRFAVLRTLGQGGMGVVYAAYDEELDRKVAIKVLRASVHGGIQGRPRMLREAQAMARLSHPNAVQVYEIDDHDEQIFVAMEFVKGRTLTQWLAEAPRSWRETRDMFLQAGRGLAAAHAEGLVHRDFKPDNVLVGADERARVADFGLAGAAQREPEPGDTVVPSSSRPNAFAASLTLQGMIMGTPAYMSPEQHMGETTDARSDQFSFCVALWAALYGEAPFVGDTLGELAEAVLAGALRDPPRGSDVPAWLHAALVRGLSTEPAQRFPDMDALLAALTHDLTPAPRRRWPLVLAISALVLALVAAAALLGPRDPSAAELAAIARLTGEARDAGRRAHWVYPPGEDPDDTAILRLVALEAMEGPASAPAREASADLREEFAAVLVELGDRYWDAPGARPFARDYYAQALVFRPDHPRARERGLLTPGQLAELADKARRGAFTAQDVIAAEPLHILAEADVGARSAQLAAYQAEPERGSAVQKALIAPLLRAEPTERGRVAEVAPVTADAPPTSAPASPPAEPPPAAPPAELAEPAAPEPPAPAEPVAPARPRGKLGIGLGTQGLAATSKPDDPDAVIERAAEDPAQSESLAAEGEAARRRGDFEAAERLFHQALAAYSRNGAALMGLSDVAFDRGRFEQAVGFAERAVKKEPARGDFRIRLGDAYFKVLRYPDAKAQYEKAAELGHPRAAARLDKVKEKVGD